MSKHKPVFPLEHYLSGRTRITTAAQIAGFSCKTHAPILGNPLMWVQGEFSFPPGTICGHCDCKSKTYARPIAPITVRELINLYNYAAARPKDRYHKRSKFKKTQDGDFAKMRFWGLIAEQTDADGNTVGGYWAITTLGKQWVEGRVSIPSRAVLYHGNLLFFQGERMSAADALGDTFDLAQLLEGGFVNESI